MTVRGPQHTCSTSMTSAEIRSHAACAANGATCRRARPCASSGVWEQAERSWRAEGRCKGGGRGSRGGGGGGGGGARGSTDGQTVPWKLVAPSSSCARTLEGYSQGTHRGAHRGTRGVPTTSVRTHLVARGAEELAAEEVDHDRHDRAVGVEVEVQPLLRRPSAAPLDRPMRCDTRRSRAAMRRCGRRPGNGRVRDVR